MKHRYFMADDGRHNLLVEYTTDGAEHEYHVIATTVRSKWKKLKHKKKVKYWFIKNMPQCIEIDSSDAVMILLRSDLHQSK